ncbi:MAG: hypothetical protein EOP51_13870 [Sphingobacteriales bacterium]|nr:MAG: hypothetical protein EOP51_13870 [Sphingobacteriales bacterium]
MFNNNGNYEVGAKNYNCFSSENEDGGVYFPPDLCIAVIKGNLRIHYAHGRYGYHWYIFRYQDLDFKLIGYDSSSNRGPLISSETSINFLTKKKIERENPNEKAEESGDEVFKETVSKIKVSKLLKLSDVKDFDELEVYNGWQVQYRTNSNATT